MARWAEVLLGLALVAAGVSKLASRQWPAQVRGLGLPAAPAVAASVPAVELAVGAAAVAGLWSPVPAIAAVVLLVAFTALLVVRLAQGRRPPCACFGRLSTRPVSWWSVARNLALLALAVAALGA